MNLQCQMSVVYHSTMSKVNSYPLFIYLVGEGFVVVVFWIFLDFFWGGGGGVVVGVVFFFWGDMWGCGGGGVIYIFFPVIMSSESEHLYF